eukprot:TRINITY_DN12809_c0_g3_i4.p2 TRINITY_DN12809_c0_g3~~TRINITY_DN12809_c0_g3_i4.p2  ORF type:complete len:409 (-),score=131.64 TRINITY_DN12809_c0_g3_i4:175-1401(-)
MMSFQIMIIQFLLIGFSHAQFICNNYKKQASCDGATASDGICGWGLFGCSSVAPLPSPTVARVEPPPLVCPPYTAEATCRNNPCALNSVCFTNNAAICVVNNCVGEFEYMGRILREPCASVFVDVASMSIVDCNVRAIVREVDEEALAEYQAQQSKPKDTKSAAAPNQATSQVDSMMLGLAPETTPTPASTTGPRIGLPPVGAPTPTTSEIDTTEEQQGPRVGLPPLDTPTPTPSEVDTDEDQEEDEEQQQQQEEEEVEAQTTGELLSPEPEPETEGFILVDGAVEEVGIVAPEPEVEMQAEEEKEEEEAVVEENQEVVSGGNVSSVLAPLELPTLDLDPDFVLPTLSVGTIVLEDDEEEEDVSPSPKPNGAPKPKNNRRNNNKNNNKNKQNNKNVEAKGPVTEEKEN